MKPKIIVTGGNGQLGNCLREVASDYPQFEFLFTDVAELDITNEEAVASMFTAQKPAWVINAAAYTAVDKAETDLTLARLLNATAVGILAREAANVGAAIVHISTDYVFDGTSQHPLTEDVTPNPQSAYGVTKLEGEQLAATNAHHIIIRTSWLYSTYGNNFVKTMRRLGRQKAEIGVVADQWGSPTSAHDLARDIMVAITKPTYGLYHYSNEGVTCWADFARQIMGFSGLECVVKDIETSEYLTPATRPAYSLLDKHKFCLTFGVVIADWEDSLEKVIYRLETLEEEKKV